MSYITNLAKHNFTSGDIHHFSSYFNVTIQIVNPFESNKERSNKLSIQQEEKMARDTVSLNGSKKLIQKIIDLGRIGATYNKEDFNKLLHNYDKNI